jgi:hypothetical protein
MVKVFEMSPGNISLEEYRWSIIDENKFEKHKSKYFKQLEDIIEGVIHKNLI